MTICMKYYCVGICCFLLATLTGCVFPVEEHAQQIAYCGKLPKSMTISCADAFSFANKFVSEAGMKNTGTLPEPNSLNNRFIDISFSGPNGITAGISINNDANQFVIVVYGDPNSPVVQKIAHKGVELFQKTYPEGNIAPCKSNHSFF